MCYFLQVERKTVAMRLADPVSSSLLLYQGSSFQLHLNVERVVTLKHMVDRLMGPNYGHRREADLIRLSDSLAQFGSSKPQ